MRKVKVNHTPNQATVIDVTDFENEVIRESFQKPVVADFWAPWCGPCVALGPVLGEIVEAASGRWKLAKINVEDYPKLAAEQGVMGIPNVVLYIDGERTAEFSGSMPKPEIEQWLARYLPGEPQS